MRLDYKQEFPQGHEAMLALEAAVRRSGLEPLLLELVKLRASQLNGCAHCLDMHSKDARARGEDDWNRLAVGLRAPVGDYVSPFHSAAA